MIKASGVALAIAFGLAFFGPALASDERLADIAALRRADGSTIIAYVDRQGRTGPQGLLIIAQGSGCGSVQNNANIAQAKTRILSNYAVVTVEDYGVLPNAPDAFPTEHCPQAYYEHHTITQRVSDYEQVFSIVQRRPWWNGKLALFGGSEGGAVVQELAPLVPASAVVVYSSATGLKFRDAVMRVLPPPVAAQAAVGFDAIRHDPNGPGLVLGNSHLWWADIMDRRLSDDLLRAKEPILIVQGERDESNPVMSARAVRDTFAAAGRSNLTYWEFPGYNHHMVDQVGVDHFYDVMAQISGWLKVKMEATTLLQNRNAN
jgi:pimeloyl-ACP methyl ester carboxylesterase